MFNVRLVEAEGELYSFCDKFGLPPLVADYVDRNDVERRAYSMLRFLDRRPNLMPDDSAEAFYPSKVKDGRVYDGWMAGGRSAAIEHEGKTFRLKGAVYAPRFAGILEEYDKELIMPPLTVPYIEHTEGRTLEELQCYDKDGTERTMFAFKPRGVLLGFAIREGLVYDFADSLGLRVGERCDGVCTYKGLRFFNMPMGHEVNEPLGRLERVDELVCGITNEGRLPSISLRTLENLNSLQDSLGGLDLYEIVFDKIMKSTGEALSRMHQKGIIHGPRQSNFGNVSLPCKDGIRMFDMENALLATELSEGQFKKFAFQDVYNQMGTVDTITMGLANAITSHKYDGIGERAPDGWEEVIRLHPSTDLAVLEGYLGYLPQFAKNGKFTIKMLTDEVLASIDYEKIRREQQSEKEEFLGKMNYMGRKSFPPNILECSLLFNREEAMSSNLVGGSGKPDITA